MLWNLDPAAPEPLVEQIAASVRRALAAGELPAGERLPSARDLADLLGVHVNTVLAAYRALREEGLVEFRRGRGVRVVPRPDTAGAARRALTDAAHAYLREGRRHGWDVDALAGLLRELA